MKVILLTVALVVSCIVYLGFCLGACFLAIGLTATIIKFSSEYSVTNIMFTLTVSGMLIALGISGLNRLFALLKGYSKPKEER